MSPRLAILTSHPIQYYAPLFREIARRFDTKVFFAHDATAEQQAAAGFGHAFRWDVDLLGGYDSEFLPNVARNPGAGHFSGCDTPTVAARLRAGRFDALLVTGWHLKSYVQGIAAARRLGIAVMARGDSQLETPRSFVRRAVKEAAYPALLRVLDAALYVGARNHAYYQHYRYPESRLFFSPHCVDTERFAAGAGDSARRALRAELGIPMDEKVVLFAGKLVPFKRPLDVIEAAAIVRREGVPASVAVAGSGELEGEMRARADALSVPLHWLGFRNQSAMPAVYAAADVLVLPSTGRETWGLVCNEALACGTPVVVSDAVGCAPDLAADGMAGGVFPAGDTVALSRVLASVLRDPPPPGAIARRSARYSVAAAADGVGQALAHVASAPSRVSA